jgi:phospholipid transport system transporter-binding protein
MDQGIAALRGGLPPPPRPTELLDGGDGRQVLRGALVFATARAAHAAGCRVIQSGTADLTFDCAGLEAADSAGVAVLLDWLAAARQRGRRLRYTALPDSVRAIARISEVEALLDAGV